MRGGLILLLALPLLAAAQQADTKPADGEKQAGFRVVEERQPDAKAPGYRIEPGTQIPLSLLSSISTKSAMEGDRVYLESIFPIMSDGKVVIPPGTYVSGTVTQVKRAGRVKGRAELFIRFDSMTLPNGVTRDFRGRVGTLDGSADESLDRDEGKISGDSNKGGDARTVGEAASGGAMIGGIAGRSAMGAGIGAAAGAAAGLVGVLATRGPDAMLERGSTMEMVMDRTLVFTEEELDFSNSMPSHRTGYAPAPSNQNQRQGLPVPGRRFPY